MHPGIVSLNVTAMKTQLYPALIGLAMLVSAAIPAHAQYITYGNLGCTLTPLACVVAVGEYQTRVVYQQAIVYNAPVIYNGPVYYLNGSASQYGLAACEPGGAAHAVSSVFVMGGGGGSYGYANSGHCNPNVVIFGSRGGWFGR